METPEKYERRLALKEKSTQVNYRSGLNKFLKHHGITREELLHLAEKDLDEVSLMLQEAMKAERDKGHAAATAHMIYKGVKFYLKSAGFRDFSLDVDDKPRLIYNGQRRVTKEHIKEFHDSFSANYRKRNRAILMFLKDSGIRISDAARLDVQHYTDARELRVNGERFKVFEPFATEKTGDYAHIHLGPESVEAIDAYLDGRTNGPLFLSQYRNRIEPKALSEMFRTVKTRRNLKGDFSKISAHSLRKYHFSSLPFSEGWIHWLEGKATSVYLDDPAEVTQAYIKNYDSLRVFGSPNQDRVAELEAEVERLKRGGGRIAELEVRQRETDAKLDQALKALKEIYEREKPKN